MAGRRVAQEEPMRTRNKSGSNAALIVLGLVAALLVGGTAGLCAYADSYEKVFPGVSLGDRNLSGLSLTQLKQLLTNDSLLAGEVVIDNGGEELGRYTQQELGAYIDGDALADAAWSVGREEGGASWLKNGWTMLSGSLGAKTSGDIVVHYDENALRRTAAEAASHFDQSQVDGSYELTEEGIYATKPAEGLVMDQEKLIEDLKALDGAAGMVEIAFTTSTGRSLDLEAIARELNSEPSPARYDIETGKVVDGTVGVHLDPQAAQFALDAAAPGERILLPAEVIYPSMTAAELEAVLFRDELGTATTNVGGTSIRRGNVRLAGECCNGVILNDGDVFDYNAVVGKRTTERGFGAAPAYVNGETVETVGGGICQVSSTIYLATLLANLETVERYAHRYAPSYIEWGMDATVSWGGPEYKFRNNTGYPIRLDVTYSKDNKITVTIMGTKTDDTYVKMTHKTLSDTGYETEYIETDELDWGTQRQTQSPYTGHNVVSYKSIYDGNGNLISQTEEARSNYKSRNAIILVGTNGKPSSDAGISPAAAPASGEPAGGTGGADSAPAENNAPAGNGSPSGDTNPALPADPPPAVDDDAPVLPPEDGSPGLSIFE